MRKLSLLAAFLVASCAGIASAVDIPLYNTGVDNAGVPLADNAPDSHWSLVAPGAQTGAPLAVTGAGGFPIPPWLADNATSAWVGTLNPTALGPTNVTREYHYQTTFNMAGLDPKSAVIAGRSSQDNFLLDVLVNGKSTGIKESTTSFGGWSDFALDSTAIGNLTGGSNTMTFIVQSATENGTDDYTSLRVEFTQKTARPVPEPSAFALLGLSALGLIRRRR